jgi:hypothetical protein
VGLVSLGLVGFVVEGPVPMFYRRRPINGSRIESA